MAAFQAAYDFGYRYFETDVILTADNKVLATHGSKNAGAVKRTNLPLRSELEGRVFSDIQQHEKIGGEPIPLLEEIFVSFPDAMLNIDSKTERVAPALGKLVNRLGVVDRVCFASFSDAFTDLAANEVGGRGRVATSAGTKGFKAFVFGIRDYFANSEVARVQVPYNIADAVQKSNSEISVPRLIASGMIDLVHEHGVAVDVWTVNREKHMKKALDLGVDGIMTDRLAIMKRVMEQSGKWQQAA